MSPDLYRSAKRWNLKLRPDEGLAFTSELPELRPEFQRMSDAEEQDYFGFLARSAGKPEFSQADIDAYWKARGNVSEQAEPELIDAVRTGERSGNISFSSWATAPLA